MSETSKYFRDNRRTQDYQAFCEQMELERDQARADALRFMDERDAIMRSHTLANQRLISQVPADNHIQQAIQLSKTIETHLREAVTILKTF